MGTETEKRPRIVIENLSLSFGGVKALSEVNLTINNREIFAIIGPNGAGKTCLLNSINGFYKPQVGNIYFDGQRITRIRPDKAAKLGLARTFQNIELYTGLSTLDNIMAARHIFMKQNVLTGSLYFGWAHTEEINHRKTVENIINFLEIEPIHKRCVCTRQVLVVLACGLGGWFVVFCDGKKKEKSRREKKKKKEGGGVWGKKS